MRNFKDRISSAIEAMKGKTSKRKTKDLVRFIKRTLQKINGKERDGLLSKINPPGSKLKRRMMRMRSGKSSQLKLFV